MLFTADTEYHKVEINDNYFVVPETDEVETTNGWKKVKELVIGDTIVGPDTNEIIIKIEQDLENNYLLYTEGGEING
jgi:hypothetical protein